MSEKILNLAGQTDEYKRVGPNWMFVLYFSVMFCLYTHTYIQLGIQLLLIVYVVLKKINNLQIRLKVDTLKNMAFYICWFGFLTLLAFLSLKLWAVNYSSDSKTMIGLFRCFAIGFALFLYCDTKEKAVSLMQSFSLAAAVLAAACLVTTPINEYFTTSESSGFGYYIGQGRNTVGAVTATTAITSYYLSRYKRFSYGKFLSVFLGIVTVLTGSRGALIQLGISIALIIVLDTDVLKMFTKTIFLVFAAVLVVVLVKNIPILYENIWMRFDAMFVTSMGDEVQDTSTLGREYYREIAWELFKQKPWLGWGIDGFKNYLVANPMYKGAYIKAVYSHCNFAELASCFGIVGLAIWYIPTLIVFVKTIKYRSKSVLLDMAWQCLVPIIILDYGRIPWANHPNTYIYFTMFILVLNVTNEIRREKHNAKLNRQTDAVNVQTNK